MIRMFIDFRKDKVKENTLYGYNNKLPIVVERLRNSNLWCQKPKIV